MVKGPSGVQFGPTTAKREFDLLITTMITDRIGRQKVLLPINHNHYNSQKKKNKTSKPNISNRDNV